VVAAALPSPFFSPAGAPPLPLLLPRPEFSCLGFSVQL